jgi:hypothetical protein
MRKTAGQDLAGVSAPGCSPVSGCVKPIPHQRARFAAGADHRHACRVSRRAGIRPGRDRRCRSRAAARTRTRPRPSARHGPAPRLPARRERRGHGADGRSGGRPRLCLRKIATTRCATRKVTSATAEVANDVSDAVAPPADDRADRDGDCEIERAELGNRASLSQRRPITATANNRTALTATHPRPLAPPINSGTCITSAARPAPSVRGPLPGVVLAPLPLRLTVRRVPAIVACRRSCGQAVGGGGWVAADARPSGSRGCVGGRPPGDHIRRPSAHPCSWQATSTLCVGHWPTENHDPVVAGIGLLRKLCGCGGLPPQYWCPGALSPTGVHSFGTWRCHRVRSGSTRIG